MRRLLAIPTAAAMLAAVLLASPATAHTWCPQDGCAGETGKANHDSTPYVHLGFSVISWRINFFDHGDHFHVDHFQGGYDNSSSDSGTLTKIWATHIQVFRHKCLDSDPTQAPPPNYPGNCGGNIDGPAINNSYAESSGGAAPQVYNIAAYVGAQNGYAVIDYCYRWTDPDVPPYTFKDCDQEEIAVNYDYCSVPGSEDSIDCQIRRDYTRRLLQVAQ
jgi:hypothetical protein